MNKILKKALAIGAGIYFTAYAGLSGYALWDIKKNSEEIYQNAPNRLIVKESSAEINGKKKQIALVGENHYSTKKESKYIEEIIKKYKHVLMEGSFKEPKNKLLTVPSPTMYFHLNGSGRLALDSDALSSMYADEKICLEDKHPHDTFGTLKRISIFGKSLLNAIGAPVWYLIGKNEKNISKEKHEEKYLNKTKPTKRDKKLAKKIIAKLKKREKAAIFVGWKHIGPVNKILNDNLGLEEKVK